MKSVRLAVTALALCLLPCMPASALTYQALDDGSLLQSADLVVTGTVRRALADPANPLGASLYQIEIADQLKGAVSGSVLVHVAGGIDPARSGSLVIGGAPRLQQDERVLGFLNRRAGGDYRFTQFALGAFHLRDMATGTTIAQRDLKDQGALPRNAGALLPDEGRQVRELARYSRWLRARAAGAAAEADYWVPYVADPAALKFAVEGTPPVRWFGFDGGGSVTLYAGPQGELGVRGGGYAQFQQAIEAWNGNPGSAVHYLYGGLTQASGGISRADGVSTLLFNDPDQELGGPFDCNTGGMVAYTGYRASGVQKFLGSDYQAIDEVDIVVRDGAGCVLNGNGGADAAELLAHELGHTLGLAHACGEEGLRACDAGSAQDDALMRPYLHWDGRGARLGEDDRAGIAWLYPADAVQRGAPDARIAGNTSSTTLAVGNGHGGAFDCSLLLMFIVASVRRRMRSPP